MHTLLLIIFNHLVVTNLQLTDMSLVSGLPNVTIMIFFLFIFHLLPSVLASPCPSRPSTSFVTHIRLLSTPGPSTEAKARMNSVTPAISLRLPRASASAATTVLVQHAAEATVYGMPSITTQDPSPFNHDQQSSWRSEDITNVLLGGITTLGSLLALGIMYHFRPLYARRQQSGRSQDIAQGPDFR